MKSSFIEYPYKTREVIFYSLCMKSEGKRVFFNFTKSSHGIRDFRKLHPVRDIAREHHREELD